MILTYPLSIFNEILKKNNKIPKIKTPAFFIKKIENMKKTLPFLFATLLFTIFHIETTTAQTATKSLIVSDTLIVNGDCSMCKKTIETACFGLKGIKKATWDDEKFVLIIQYDTSKTNTDAILKRVALAGYDNEKYKADDKAYSRLHKCCQYDRSRLLGLESKKQ